MAHACGPSTRKVEAGMSEVQGHPRPHSEPGTYDTLTQKKRALSAVGVVIYCLAVLWRCSDAVGVVIYCLTVLWRCSGMVEVVIYCLAILVEMFRCTRSLFVLLFRQCEACIASGRLQMCCHTADSLSGCLECF